MMWEYVLHRVILTRNGCKEDESFNERIYDNLTDAINWMEHNKRLDQRLYKQYDYYIEYRIKLDYA